MDFEDEEFIKREQSDDLLFEAYDEPVKTKAIKEMQESNEHLLNYLIGRKKFTKAKVEEIEYEGTYSWGSEAEAYLVVKDNKYLLGTVPTFIEFIEREI